jgi:alkanesulfonate monooxygenase SsuD/methylene tetrahydromethanopterin reductase-like flavin-dependent oxidoreductase (luciferase family)
VTSCTAAWSTGTRRRSTPEHDAIGIPFEPVGTRIAKLAEAIAVLKGCFGDERFSFAGEHYTITDYDA